MASQEVGILPVGEGGAPRDSQAAVPPGAGAASVAEAEGSGAEPMAAAQPGGGEGEPGGTADPPLPPPAAPPLAAAPAAPAAEEPYPEVQGSDLSLLEAISQCIVVPPSGPLNWGSWVQWRSGAGRRRQGYRVCRPWTWEQMQMPEASRICGEPRD